MSYDFTFILAK